MEEEEEEEEEEEGQKNDLRYETYCNLVMGCLVDSMLMISSTQRRRRAQKLAQGVSPGKRLCKMANPGGVTHCHIPISRT
jgi:hypothetical protein